MQQAKKTFKEKQNIGLDILDCTAYNRLKTGTSFNSRKVEVPYMALSFLGTLTWKKLGTLIFGLLISLTLLACHEGPAHEKKSSDIDANTTKVAAPDKNNAIGHAPDLTLEDASGKQLRISDLKGKVVFINFWATWCPPCRQEMPTIDQLHAHFKANKSIVFLMVDIDGKVEGSTKYVTNKGYDLPVYKAVSSIAPQYLGQAIPTTVILGKEGAIAARIEGGMDYSTQEVINGITELVNK